MEIGLNVEHHGFHIGNAVTRTTPARAVLLSCGGCLEPLKAENSIVIITLILYYTRRYPALELMIRMLAVLYGRSLFREK